MSWDAELTVCWALDVMNVSASTNSWIVSVNAKITAERIPASEIGMTICTIARPATAVHRRRLLDVLRNGLEESHEQPDAEGNCEARIDEHERLRLGLSVARWARFTSLPYFFSHPATTSVIGAT